MTRIETAERRPLPRRTVFLSALLVSPDGKQTADCVINDLSPNGARVTLQGATISSDSFYFVNKRERTAHLATVTWHAPPEIGLKFGQRFELTSKLPPNIAFLKEFTNTRSRR